MSVVLPNFLVFGLVVLAIAVFVAVRISRGERRPSHTIAERECHACKKWMRRDASACPHCGTPTEPWVFHDGRWWVVREGASYYLDEKSQSWVRFEPGVSPPPQG